MKSFRRQTTLRWGRCVAAALMVMGGLFVHGGQRAEAQQAGFVYVDAVQSYKPGTSAQENPPNFGQAVAPPGTWKQVSAGRHHTCGIRSDDMLVCWGDNSSGQRA